MITKIETEGIGPHDRDSAATGGSAGCTITRPSGGGKSTLARAIAWVLWGEAMPTGAMRTSDVSATVTIAGGLCVRRRMLRTAKSVSTVIQTREPGGQWEDTDAEGLSLRMATYGDPDVALPILLPGRIPMGGAEARRDLAALLARVAGVDLYALRPTMLALGADLAEDEPANYDMLYKLRAAANKAAATAKGAAAEAEHAAAAAADRAAAAATALATAEAAATAAEAHQAAQALAEQWADYDASAKAAATYDAAKAALGAAPPAAPAPVLPSELLEECRQRIRDARAVLAHSPDCPTCHRAWDGPDAAARDAATRAIEDATATGVAARAAYDDALAAHQRYADWHHRAAALGDAPVVMAPPSERRPVHTDGPDPAAVMAAYMAAAATADATAAAATAAVERVTTLVEAATTAAAEAARLTACVDAARRAPGVIAEAVVERYAGPLAGTGIVIAMDDGQATLTIDGRPWGLASTGEQVLADAQVRSAMRTVAGLRHMPIVVDDAQLYAGPRTVEQMIAAPAIVLRGGKTK